MKWPWYSEECRAAVDQLLRDGGGLSAYRSNPQHPVGPREGSWVRRLEQRAEDLTQIHHAVACNSGTMALMAGLQALGQAPGSEVVTSPYTFSATVAAIQHTNLRPVFGDVDPETYTLDPAVAPRSACYLPVDLFGLRASRDFPGLVVADSCQAADPGFTLSPVLWAAWSFNGHKQIPAGEAGMLLTNRNDIAERARRFISHGENWQGIHVGMNGRINELTACVAYYGLQELGKRNAERRCMALNLWQNLLNQYDPRILPLTEEHIDGHALYVYPFRVRMDVDRAAYVARLNAAGLTATEGYLIPQLHHYPAFRHFQVGPLPVVEELSSRTLVLLPDLQPGYPTPMPAVAQIMVEALDGTPSLRLEPGGDVTWV